jgi:hypothetical protein
MGQRAGLDTDVRGKISYLCWESNLDVPVVQSVARHYIDRATPCVCVCVCVCARVCVQVKTHKTIILPVVLYGCETWSLTLREEHRLRAFENRVLRRIFGPKRDEVTGK